MCYMWMAFGVDIRSDISGNVRVDEILKQKSCVEWGSLEVVVQLGKLTEVKKTFLHWIFFTERTIMCN
jgi:hypothetical protein